MARKPRAEAPMMERDTVAVAVAAFASGVVIGCAAIVIALMCRRLDGGGVEKVAERRRIQPVNLPDALWHRYNADGETRH